LQAHTTLKLERDEIESKRRAHSNQESEIEAKHTELQALYTNVLQQLAAADSEKDTLSQEKSKLQAQVTTTQKTVSELQEKLAKGVTDIAANSRQLQAVQVELRNANRRADDAEKTQNNLQVEGTSLMRSLDEMRPKIVELTGVKLELAERIDGLEHTLRSRVKTITELESAMDEMRDQQAEADKRAKEVIAQREKERFLAASDSSELQKAYTELQAELDSATASLHNLEAERSSHHQEAARRLEEIERLTTSSRTQTEELSTLRRELDARRDAQVCSGPCLLTHSPNIPPLFFYFRTKSKNSSNAPRTRSNPYAPTSPPETTRSNGSTKPQLPPAPATPRTPSMTSSSAPCGNNTRSTSPPRNPRSAPSRTRCSTRTHDHMRS
jgi:chromosome segregation ATPase